MYPKTKNTDSRTRSLTRRWNKECQPAVWNRWVSQMERHVLSKEGNHHFPHFFYITI